MSYEPFYERFGDLAWKETRSMKFLKDPRLAGDEFGFLELYCNDENCDCRRVTFNVVSRKSQKTVAVIAYGWESREFYAKWYRQNDPEIIREMQGPVLNSASHQPELAPALLEKVRDVLLADPEYIARLKQHYRMFKEKVDPKHFRTASLPESEIRPIPKYKKRPRSK
ncbi:MAG: hypothetical protein AB1894_12160 [Chloroflexota bacterium]